MIMMLILPLVASRVPNSDQLLKGGARFAPAVMMLVGFVISLVGIAAGIGVVKLQQWARITLLVWAAFATFLCGLFVGIFLFIPLPVPQREAGLTPGALKAVVISRY
jgi:hypothetical protein